MGDRDVPGLEVAVGDAAAAIGEIVGGRAYMAPEQARGGESAPPTPPPLAPSPASARGDSIDAPLTYGGRFARYDGISARQLARRCPGLAQWCAENREDRVGRLCAEALGMRMVGPIGDGRIDSGGGARPDPNAATAPGGAPGGARPTP
jgi:hypothetical protein